MVPEGERGVDVHECAGTGADRLLSFGKARVSYGETGKEPGVYSTNTTLGSGSFGSGYGDVTKATQGGFGGLLSSGTRGNPDLKPERQKEVEGGCRLRVLRSDAPMPA